MSQGREAAGTSKPSKPDSGRWSLEIVRGREAGRRYRLIGAGVLLGRAPTPAAGDPRGAATLSLAPHEPEGPATRRMSDRHARLDPAPDGQGWLLSDLDGSTGTFLNKQRLLAGQARPLRAGDVIQLGPIQLRVAVEADVETAPAPSPKPAAAPSSAAKPAPAPPSAAKPAPARPAAAAPPSPARPAVPSPAPTPTPPASPSPVAAKPPAPAGPVAARPASSGSGSSAGAGAVGSTGGGFPFRLANGSVCRDWNDFLTVAAQRWEALREELTSGRLAAFAVGAGRPELVPDPRDPGGPDERLDRWLGAIPATIPRAPELELFPESVEARFNRGVAGGVVQRKLRLSNVGLRLLSCRPLRVESENGGRAPDWVRVPEPWDRRPFPVIDAVEIPIEIRLPEPDEPSASANADRAAILVVETNGGSRRVPIRRVPAAAAAGIPTGIGVGLGGPGESDEANDDPDVARGWDFGKRWLLEDRPAAERAIAGALMFGGLRLLTSLANAFLGGATALPLGDDRPPLAGAAAVLGAIGAARGVRIAIGKRAPADIPYTAFAGIWIGLIVACVHVAVCRTIEPTTPLAAAGLPSFAIEAIACALWAGLGAVVALALGRSGGDAGAPRSGDPSGSKSTSARPNATSDSRRIRTDGRGPAAGGVA